ncbi:Histone-lysine N-methyltransferase like protein [Verticillium longisporum]|uniref:Histone-lysine N-methyltransferase like protein n=1 Tax=Verticillium longisporum TaxID=100787 RepID=A0A8I2Z424_VERLO|nr:ATP-dependent RNA helicase glh-4 [Verticillium dahliae VDG1]KAG7109490.1 Histone-lysine N-methyltransferase like protein [Verticillium longisporum]
MEGITRRHFFHHADTEKQTPGITKEKADCHWCQIRAFPTHATHPITIINDIDDATLPSNFRFLQSSVLGEGVQAAEDSFRSGCDCTDDQDCQYGGCLCLQEQDDADGNDNDNEDDDDEEVAAGSSQREQGRKKIYRYHTHGAKAGLLRSKFLHEGGGSTQPLYECHEGLWTGTWAR